MNEYVLVQNEFGEKIWYLLINDIKALYRAADIKETSSVTQYLNDRRGLNIEFMKKNSIKYVQNIAKYINMGHIVIVNSVGGYRFLDEKLTILKRKFDTSHPINSTERLNGILLENGVFKSCEYGQHKELIRELKGIKPPYVVISYDSIGENSSIFIEGTLTEEQRVFLKDNIENLHKVHIDELYNSSILTER
ncbi:TPA: hypothetical protein ACSQRE_000137 [Clostridium perfringens]